MKALFIFILLFGIIRVLTDKVRTNFARYDNYRIYRVEIDTPKHIEIFQEIGKRGDNYVLYGSPRKVGQKLTVVVAAHKIAEITDILQTYDVEHQILNYNLQEKIDQQWKDVMPKHTSPGNFDWDHYFHLETINAWLEEIADKYEYVSMVEMGSSSECFPIKGVKLAKHKGNTAIFVESGIHAREWIAPATATYILNELLTSTDPAVQKAASEFNWFIFPVVNPDGYKYSFEHDRMWRKNRSLFGTCRGVDLNRNFPYHWNESGSSSDPCHNIFAGMSAASETETKAIMNFLEKNFEKEKIRTYFALHSFSQFVMYPYGTDEKPGNCEDLHEIGIKAVQAIKETTGKDYVAGSIHEAAYLATGVSVDWVHKVLKTPITFVFELRGAPNTTDLFILPANEIRDTARETLAAILVILEEAQKLGYYQ